MIFKLIIFAVIGFVIYKLLGGKFPKLPKSEDRDSDSLVECDTCHTYATVKDSIISNGKHYCSKECLK